MQKFFKNALVFKNYYYLCSPKIEEKFAQPADSQ